MPAFAGMTDPNMTNLLQLALVLNMTTIAEALLFAEDKLKESDLDSKREAIYLLSHILGKPVTSLIAYPDTMLTENELKSFSAFVERRSLGEPFAYIKKSKSFWDVELEVNSSVLIPRPETELLVEKILSLNLKSQATILDLGTGSGAIAISLAVHQPEWCIVATDKSILSLELASSNAKKYHLNNIAFYQGSWFNALPTQTKHHTFDVIVSNPPYIAADSEYLKKGDVRFEPLHALVADKKGLADIEEIIFNAKKHLNPGGYLIIEHGYNQADDVQALFLQAKFSQINTLKDIQHLDRVTYGQHSK